MWPPIVGHARSTSAPRRDVPQGRGWFRCPSWPNPFNGLPWILLGPRTQRGNRFILTICDYATRYPEAIALPSTDACRVARELVAFFTLVGIPEEILTDKDSISCLHCGESSTACCKLNASGVRHTTHKLTYLWRDLMAP